MANHLRDKRLDRDLGKNELRDYLEHKEETGFLIPDYSTANFKKYKKALNHKPNVLLIAPPITIPRYMQKRCIPPLGLSYIASSLEKSGINVSMIDCTVEGYETERYSNNLMTYGLTPEELEKKFKKM